MRLQLTKVFKKVEEGYVGFVKELPEVKSQAPTLEEVKVKLEAAIEFALKSDRYLSDQQAKGN